MAIQSLKNFLREQKLQDEQLRIEFGRQKLQKDKYIKRIMDSSVRLQGTAFRQAMQYANEENRNEELLIFKQRGIMRRIMNNTARLLSMAFNT